MLEKEIEQKLVEIVKQKGGLAVKLHCVNFVGMPDRLVLLRFGKVGFVETKAPKGKPRPIQLKRMKQLKELGFKCFVLDNTEKINEVLDAIQTT